MKKFIYLFLFAFLFLFSLSSCKDDEIVIDDYNITVTAPSGAPSIALAPLAINNEDNYNFINADTIAAAFSSKESDFIIAPINAGAKLFKAGKSDYKLTAVITWGNLFFASQIEDFNLDTINGKELILFGEGTINASIANYVLNQKGIEPSNITYLAGASNTQATLISNPEAIVMTAEPALTAAKTQKPNISSISVQSLYKEVSGNAEFAQAGIFVKEDMILNHSSLISDFLLEVKEVSDNINSKLDDLAKTCVELKLLPNETVAKTAIPNCNIKFKDAKEVKSQIESTAKIDLAQYGGDLPSEEFYYSAF